MAEKEHLQEIASTIIEEMENDNGFDIIGPGATMYKVGHWWSFCFFADWETDWKSVSWQRFDALTNRRT